MPLNTKQKAAVEYLEGPLLVLAGPGTGKTQLLSAKVEHILKTTDASPENILCLTFTDSGATNMRARLLQAIGKNASKVHIHTYHSFGSAILAEYKNYADHFSRNLDAAIDNVTQFKIVKSIQQSLDAFDILKYANTSDIISTISSAKSARLTGKNLEKIAQENIKIAEQLNPKLNSILQNYEKGMKFDAGIKAVYLPLMEELKNYISTEPICLNFEREANIWLRELNSIIETEREKDGQTNPATGKPLRPSISPLTKWKDRHFEKDADGNYRLSNRIANKKLLSLAHIMQQYEAYLESSALYDFADMIQQAITILREDNGFKLTLEERYQYILLDEFQDTNAAQAELIARLTDYEKPCIMAVGDDDQAIFAFQGANASNLSDFQSHYDAKVITLTENYRSSSDILDTSYKIREQIDDSFASKQGIIKRLFARHPKITKEPTEISRHEFLESSAEYHWVAARIAELISQGVPQSDIAVITPKHKYIAPFLPYLKSYNGQVSPDNPAGIDLKISYEKRDNLFENPRIHEILTLSRFIHELSLGKNPAHLLFEVLSFPFLQVPPLDAIRAINRVPRKFTLDYLLESDLESLQRVGLFIAELTAKSATAPLEQFLDYLIGTIPYSSDARSNFLSYYANQDANYSTFELYENLSTLREAVLKHSTKQKLALADLIVFADDYAAADAPLINTSPYQDASDSIQILTAHKSKGLEFKYVFIIAADDRAWGNAKGNNNMLSLPANVIQIRHTGITENERLRLFFVAITRAKSYLYITNSIKDFSGKNPARLQYLAEYEDGDKIISPYLPEKSREVILHYQQLPEDKQKSDLKTSWLATYNQPNPDLKPILLSRLENYQLTATDLTTFIDIAYAGPQTFYQQKILRAPDESYSPTLTFGNLIHATFEQITNEKLNNEQALDYYESQLASASIPDEDLEDLHERGKQTLRASLKAFGPLLRNQNARAEVNLYHDHLTLPPESPTPPVPITGKIDHISINDATKTIEVYDFKTSGGLSDKKWDSHPTLFKYKLQLGFYKLLLNLSPEYRKYKVTRAHILFVVPDLADAKVHDKVYEYNDADEQLLKSLIRAVYPQIKTLSFAENPDLFIPPDKSKGIKDILDFVKFMLDKQG